MSAHRHDGLALFDASPTPMLLVDRESGTIVTANDAATAFYGYAHDAFAGMPIARLNAASPDRIREAMATADTQGATFAFEHRLANGEVRPVEVVSGPVEIDGRHLLYSVIRPRDEEGSQSAFERLREASTEVARAIAREQDRAALWQEACRIVVEVAGFELAWIAAVEPEPDEASGLAVMKVEAAFGRGAGDFLGRRRPMRPEDPSAGALAVQQGRRVVVGDIATDTRVATVRGPALRNGFRWACAIPLTPPGAAPFAALVVLGSDATNLDERRLGILERIGEELGLGEALHRAYAERAAAEARARELVEHLGSGVVLFTADGEPVWSNRAMAVLLGWEREVPASELRALLRRSHDDIDGDLLARLRRDGLVVCDRRLARSDGSEVIVEAHLQRHGDDTIQAGLHDVTIQRAAERALAESELRYRTLFSVLDHGVIIANADGTVEAANPVAQRILGSPDAPVVGTRPGQFVQYLRLDGSVMPVDELPTPTVRRTGRATPPQTFGIRRVDGEIVWVTGSAAPLEHDAEGQPLRVVGSVADVTELQQAKALLATSESRLREVLDGTIDGIVTVGADGRFTYGNRAALELLAAHGVPLLELSPFDVLDPDCHEALARDLELVRGGVPLLSEYPLRAHHGVERWVAVSQQGIGDGTIWAVIRDITERRVADELVRESRLALAEAQRIGRVGSWELELDPCAWTWSDETFRIVGHAPGDVLPSTAQLAAVLEETEMARLQAALDDTVISGRPLDEEVQVLRPGGRMIHARIMAERTTRRGRPLIRGSIADISDVREAQARADRAQRLEMVGQLAGGVAHDFNNVLTAVAGYAGLLQASLEPDDARLADIAEVLHATDRASRLTRQLLAFGRRQALQVHTLDMDALLLNIRPLLASACGDTVVLTLTPSALRPWVDADAAAMEQVIVNLALNARDAMPEGGTLSIGTSVVQLGADADVVRPPVTPGSYVRIAIEDTGTGIPQDVLGHIFEPFYTTKDVGRGSGLGLSSAEGLVTQMRGHVAVTTEPGHGTVFSVLLPLVVPTPGIAEAARAGAGTASRSAKRPVRHRGPILVVDDETIVRTLVRRILTSAGYEVLSAGTPEEALEIAARPGAIELLVTDVLMPGMNGHQLAGRLLTERPDLRVVYMSAYSPESIFGDGVLPPEVPFLAKPFTSAQLERLVETALADR